MNKNFKKKSNLKKFLIRIASFFKHQSAQNHKSESHEIKVHRVTSTD
ncbi:hypothetical protein FLJC2902T_16920 [Flavobacterium limnosediminis JC2902]|uniref:Uncharacterized protein n=1 Tax=Flavobacterium limnosediminis JC2902 TaxID=1341181 RepID=V6SNZ7_9FLAO|nr:hypothetical protein FLJC2902T_16920 [Flavobacterium limnosediminis JC2902]